MKDQLGWLLWLPAPLWSIYCQHRESEWAAFYARWITTTEMGLWWRVSRHQNERWMSQQSEERIDITMVLLSLGCSACTSLPAFLLLRFKVNLANFFDLEGYYLLPASLLGSAFQQSQILLWWLNINPFDLTPIIWLSTWLAQPP